MSSPSPAASAVVDDEQRVVSLRLHSPVPESLEIGRGQFLVVSGDCLAPGKRVVSASLILGERKIDAELSLIEGGVSFWQAAMFTRDMIGKSVPFGIRINLDDGESVHQLGRINCEDVRWEPVRLRSAENTDGLVAICMATYNPELDAFKRQINSIREQSYTKWICIINDDGSREDLWERMQSSCAGDDRFLFFRNADNVGFYRNFETVLKRAPLEADYVAFSDQDDRWYPHKLARLLEELQTTRANLVFSDMRIVDEDEKQVAATYWVNRKNEYRDLAVVLVANTVTGAASLFKRNLLEYLIPFPPKVGDAFHDHWLACVAMSTGRLAYVDAPLYLYYQYGGSVIGHCDFVRFTMKQRFIAAARLAFRLIRPGVAGPLLRRKYASALAIYRGECRRLRLVGNTIMQRCQVGLERQRHLRLFDGGFQSVMRLLILHVKVLIKGQTTDDAELRLAMGELARIVERRRQTK